ncbi:MAG: sigma-E factor negative regulatory protein [Proteobacteria bacterium]|nr:sigma-E factor negative regulatory protein [Pseudomonadota bacterium]
MNEELDSQLSAMFDDELPAEECELLARRLSRDPQLQARWGRYAVVGAAIRAEQGVRLNVSLAQRVSSVVVAEPELAAAAMRTPQRPGRTWWRPVAGAAVAAGVAAVCVSWIRTQGPAAPTLVARAAPPAVRRSATGPATAATPASAAGFSYVVPPVQKQQAPLAVPSTELANYVVAHSIYSPPVTRRNLLSAFMTGEGGIAVPGADMAPPQDAGAPLPQARER